MLKTKIFERCCSFSRVSYQNFLVLSACTYIHPCFKFKIFKILMDFLKVKVLIYASVKFSKGNIACNVTSNN